MASIKTTCPYCGVGCGVIAEPKPDGSLTIKGDPDHPANFGRLCSKGAALGETLGLDDRLLFPEINGVRTDWDSALDRVAEKFSSAIHDYGPDSVAFYVSGQILTEDYYVANKLMKGFIGSANIDTNSRLCMASSVAGHRKAFGSDTVPGTYEDLELADLIVLVGSNLAWCHPVLYQRIEAAKKARPTIKVVLIDPRRTMTASIADLHLPIAPDGDVALFNGLLTYLSQHGVLDSDYMEANTKGFEAALDAASSLSADQLMEKTGLGKDALDRFFGLFSQTRKVVTVYSQGVNQSTSGTDKVSAILNCHLATGRIGRPGMGPFSVTGQPNAMGGREVGGLANMLACHMDLENSTHRETVQSFWGSPVIAERQGLKAVDMFDAVAKGKIKAIWIMSTNPVDSLPDADQVAAALKACPFVVVSDILEETDTTAYAHVKLPATGWGEKHGTVTNSERRISRQRMFISAPGEARPDWWHMAEVGKRMGFADAFDYRSPAQIFDEFARLSAADNNGERDFDIGGLAGLSQDAYQDLCPTQWPVVDKTCAKETRFFSEGDFYTPDRKARFIPVVSNSINLASPNYPFVLNTGRVRDHWHTMTRTGTSPSLSSHLAEPFCEINPKDAGEIHVDPAGLIQLHNHLGSITVRALITDRVAPGSVFVPMHWTDQFTSNGRVDRIIPARLDPFSGQPASKNVAVALRPLKAAAYAFMVSRSKPHILKGQSLYWATARCEGGWRTELAFATRRDAMVFGEQSALRTQGHEALNYNDATNSGHRVAVFAGPQLEIAYYMAVQPVLLSREWLVKQLSTEFHTCADRQKVLAGRADAGVPDKGPIVCSCMGVGRNEVAQAIHSGNMTVEGIGKSTLAGTNCGSCRAEINGMIHDIIQETRIAAE